MILSVLIYHGKNQSVPDVVLESIMRQRAPFGYTIVPFVYCSNKDLPSRQHQIENMTYLKRYASKPYTVYMPSYTVLTSDHDLLDLWMAMQVNPRLDALSLNAVPGSKPNENRDHIRIDCWIVKYYTLMNLQFRQVNGSCLCVGINKDLRIHYLDNRQLMRTTDYGIGD